MAQRGQVNADLMGPPRLQSARQQRVAGQPLRHVHVGHGLLAVVGVVGDAASAVAAVADQAEVDALRRREAGHDGEVTPDDGVGVELLTQAALGRDGAGEDH